MKKRRILLPALLALLLTVSGKAEEDSMPFVTAVKIEESEMEEGQSREDFSENSAERNASGEAASQQSLSEKIAMEISNAEEREKAGGSRHTAGEMYQLWDDTLNTVWRLLEENLSKADMEVLRNEERDWIASKDEEVLAAGLENEGGSLQPLLEATTAAEPTKARVYELEQQSSILTETQGPDNISLIPAEAA